MENRTFMAAVAAAALALPGAATAAGEAELKALREQLQLLKREYEQRIDALEKRLRQAESAAERAEGAAARAEGAAAKAEGRANRAESAANQATAQPASAATFNPGISLILNGVYANLSQDPARYRIGGFVPTGGDAGPGRRGFSLGESELVVAANVDHYFRGSLIAAIRPDDGVGVEEATLQTLGLPGGLTLKAGRFYSSVGYVNEIHTHAWDFADAPLASRAFLGGRFADDGVQLKWLAPTDTYIEFGAEAGRGRGFPASDRDKNGVGASNLFARIGGDIGASTAWRVGLSNLHTSAQNRGYSDLDSTATEVDNRYSGASRLWVLDGVLKWAPNGNGAETNFKLQGEYFRRSEDGNLTYNSANAAAARATATGAFNAAQSGWYAQGVYQFMPRWRAGYRYDRLNSGGVKLGLVDSGALTAADFPALASHRATRNSLMLDFNPSETSRLRLQLAADKSQPGVTDRQVYLQYIMSLGAHGAHKF